MREGPGGQEAAPRREASLCLHAAWALGMEAGTGSGRVLLRAGRGHGGKGRSVFTSARKRRRRSGPWASGSRLSQHLKIGPGRGHGPQTPRAGRPVPHRTAAAGPGQRPAPLQGRGPGPLTAVFEAGWAGVPWARMGGWGLGGWWEGSRGRWGVTGQESPQSCPTCPSRASPPQLALETPGRRQGAD